MNFRIQVVIIADDSSEQVQVIADIPRGAATLDTLGLTLAESKHVLQQLQRTMIDEQVAIHLDPQRACPDCGVFDRINGALPLFPCRWCRSGCTG
jgi:hypothetical protein